MQKNHTQKMECKIIEISSVLVWTATVAGCRVARVDGVGEFVLTSVRSQYIAQ